MFSTTVGASPTDKSTNTLIPVAPQFFPFITSVGTAIVLGVNRSFQKLNQPAFLARLYTQRYGQLYSYDNILQQSMAQEWLNQFEAPQNLSQKKAAQEQIDHLYKQYRLTGWANYFKALTSPFAVDNTTYSFIAFQKGYLPSATYLANYYLMQLLNDQETLNYLMVDRFILKLKAAHQVPQVSKALGIMYTLQYDQTSDPLLKSKFKDLAIGHYFKGIEVTQISRNTSDELYRFLKALNILPRLHSGIDSRFKENLQQYAVTNMFAAVYHHFNFSHLPEFNVNLDELEELKKLFFTYHAEKYPTAKYYSQVIDFENTYKTSWQDSPQGIWRCLNLACTPEPDSSRWREQLLKLRDSHPYILCAIALLPNTTLDITTRYKYFIEATEIDPLVMARFKQIGRHYTLLTRSQELDIANFAQQQLKQNDNVEELFAMRLD